MGYLISAHITHDRPNIEWLTDIPSSIGYQVYYHRTANVYIIDTFRASRPSDFPFQTPVPAIDISSELPAELFAIESVYSYLKKLKLANTLKKSYINFGLLLNRLLGMSILSFISDDDEFDFACTVADGSLSRLKCRCEDLVISYQNGITQIQPLIPELEEEEEFLSNIAELRTALPDISVGDRDLPWNSQLHAIAIEEWRLFSGTNTMILGLGSFDPPEDESDWQLIGGS